MISNENKQRAREIYKSSGFLDALKFSYLAIRAENPKIDWVLSQGIITGEGTKIFYSGYSCQIDKRGRIINFENRLGDLEKGLLEPPLF